MNSIQTAMREPAEQPTLVQTRVPQAMRAYLKTYAKYRGVRMEKLLTEVLMHFIELRPDTQGLQWRKPKSHRSGDGAEQGWAQINLQIEDEIAGRLAELSDMLGKSRATIAYTALFWFAKYMRPPVLDSKALPAASRSLMEYPRA